MPHRATERQVLVFAPGLDNGRVLAGRLEAAAIGCRVSTDVDDFAAQLTEFGEALGAVVVTADALRMGAGPVLTRFRSREPAWSRLPVVLLAPAGTAGIDAWPGTDTLTQPTTARRLIAHVERAIESRSRQRRMARDHDALHQLAHHDPLTGLPNRLALYERIRELQADRRERQAGFAVAFVDLDDFKRVNDEYGHAVGDEALCQVATMLTRTVRESDFVARWGGDEFVVLLLGPGDAQAVAESLRRIRAGVVVRVDAVRAPLIVSCSVGLLDDVAPEQTPDDILRLADTRMYEQKAKPSAAGDA
jgi:diguanylate cyclase (GGDEF)-like protein